MTPHYMTAKQLRNACRENKYISVRFSDCSTTAINCKLAFIKKFKNVPDDVRTAYIGFRPCNFMEYISTKNPFLL